jgi:small-conductance mechanosensitive channel
MADILNLAQALLILILGAVASNMIARGIIRILAQRLDQQQKTVFQPLLFYSLLTVFVFLSLDKIGLRGEIVGALVGLLALGLGFAARSPAANIMSGLFLLAERPFVIGDLVEVETHTGHVTKIGLMSTQMKTFDNIMIRFPNEKLINADLKNLTRFKIRRIEIPLELPTQTQWSTLRECLAEISQSNPLCLEEPQPTLFFRGIHEGVATLQWNLWCATDNLVQVKTEVYEELTRVFTERGFYFVGPKVDFSTTQNMAQDK